jgi:phytoene desaturase
MSLPKVAIIGSGVAGLAAAIRLASLGYEVDVFEKNNYPGGKLSLIEKEGFRFDAGPSLFTQPNYLEALFRDVDESMEAYFSYEKVDLSCRYFFENGKIINAWTDRNKYEAELVTHLGEKPGTLNRYLNDSEQLYHSVGSIFLNHSLHRLKTWIRPVILRAFRKVRLHHLFGTLDSYNQSRFRSKEAVQIFNRYATYNGSDPYQTPGMMSMIPHLELNEGTCYPRGGMISITNALYKLASKKGVRFHLGTSVNRIVTDKNRVNGIETSKGYYPAEIVVSNADVYFTYQHLLGDHKKAKRLLRQERSCSGQIFYWGMKRSFPNLHLHNIFFSQDYQQEFKSIFKDGKLYDDPTVYVNITSKMESGQAPEGKENWFLLINAPARMESNQQKDRLDLRKAVIKKLSSILKEDIETAIETEEYLDPLRVEQRTGSYLGALYGTSSNTRMAAFLRHPNFHSSCKGLYFCGGSVHPGGGIPLCFKSAEIAVNEIEKEIHKH